MSDTAQDNATLTQIEALLAELTESQKAYDEWAKTQPSNLDAQRSAWLGLKDRLHAYDPDALFAWKSREPGLAEKPEVVAAKEKIAKLQSGLAAALTYSLSQFIWPAAIEASSGGKTQIILKACDTKSERPDGNGAPLRWGGSLPVSDVYEIARAFYLKLLAVEQEDRPLVSKAIFSLVQATSGFIEYQIPGLSIATESLIRATFPGLGSVKDEFREDVQKFLQALPAMGLSANLTKRLDGAAKGMLNPDNASAIRAFVQDHGLDLDVLKAWQDLRRSSAHGGQIPYEKLDEIWEKRSKVLSLCHAIVLTFIGYSGKRTNYHQKGHPQGEWTTS